MNRPPMKVKINSCSVDEVDSVDPGLLWKIAELEKKRKTRNPRKNKLLVDVPEFKKFLDTATMPMILTVVGTALFAKLLMMYDDSTEQERIERKIKETPGLGSVRMLTREEWDAIQEVRPRTPFESKIARPNAKIRTGEPLIGVTREMFEAAWRTDSGTKPDTLDSASAISQEDVKDWTVDVFADALTRAEETAKHGSN
ncbi:succinyl-CoA ligase [ADP-forming] subunit beta [Striga asiatica]|uniref:Succinyl-CoA ligase [ADP-forming] subunit beta n=1 Tax=Striga asiatica TaxID=4170 RepID=A0A5A7QCA7_STRAF|nr:succinyl-CoA ligase [ADP-forming] subunit beta [Striga asiatica]